MNTKEIDKKYRAYSKYYKNLLINEGIKEVDESMSSYEKRLKEMYNSKKFKAHNVYPSTNVSFVYAVIAMCLELKEAGYTDERIVPVVEKCMASRCDAFIKGITDSGNEYIVSDLYKMGFQTDMTEEEYLRDANYRNTPNVAEEKLGCKSSESV